MKDITKQKIFQNFAVVETKVADGAPRTLVVKISTPTPDRSKDTVQPMGMVADNFLKNAVVQFAHNYADLPIAKCTSLKASDSGILATVEFPQEGVYEKADIIYWMYKNGYLNAWSIGFMPLEYEENALGGYNFKKWELFEFSSVPVPDNPEALTVMRSKGINVDAVVEKEEAVTPEEAGKKEAEAQDATVKEVLEKGTTEETPAEEVAPADDAKIADLTVAQLKALVAPKVEEKDINEVIALSYVLDELHYFIRAFQQAGVSQESIDKLQQALALVMEVTQMQAVIGEKSVELKDFTVKSGRAISAKHEKMLKAACEHMQNGMDAVNGVLEAIAEQEPDGDEGGKEVEQPLTKRLFAQIGAAKNQMKKSDKEIGLTLRLIKEIESEKRGGEKK